MTEARPRVWVATLGVVALLLVVPWSGAARSATPKGAPTASGAPTPEGAPVAKRAPTAKRTPGSKRAPAGPDAPDPTPDDAAPPLTPPLTPPTDPDAAPPPAAPLRVDGSDRDALAALGLALPQHGVPAVKPPARMADDAFWQDYARKLLEVFAPRTLRNAARDRLVETERPLSAAIDKLVPRHRRYVALQRELLAAARLALTHPVVQPKAPYAVRFGVTAPEVALLRERLLQEGYGDPNVVGRLREYFDPRLKRALGQWERDHGLPQTVVIDPLTRQRLNGPLPDRVPVIALALARWRELELRADRGRQILVHLNELGLVAEEDGRPVLHMDVIVGRATGADATPATSAPLGTVVVHPDWRVPKRIVDEALRPRAEGVPEVLIDEGYEVEVASNGDWRVRLPPGPDNPLGELKFLLRGTDGVYLHDTNRRDLFKKAERALSHGCVRVAAPRELAVWVVGARAAELEAALEGRAQVRFDVEPVVATHLVYQTLSVGEDGHLVTHRDLYGRDAEALAGLDVTGVAAALVAQAAPAAGASGADQGSGASSGATR